MPSTPRGITLIVPLVALGLFLVICGPVAAQEPIMGNGAAPLTLRPRRDPLVVTDLATVLYRLKHEWPRLLLDYTRPAVRDMIVGRGGPSSLTLKTTLFHNDARRLRLEGGFGRDGWGEREARISFTAGF